MKNKILISLLLFTVLLNPALRADEGMWIPLLIEKYNIKLMQERGFKLTSEDIYSVNKACMKDAIVLFGNGCTGEVISSEGLMITNHHCGYGQIQKHSTLAHDYLTDGFWAMSQKEELPNPGLHVTFLKRMEDVTEDVMKGVTEGMDEVAKEEKINNNISDIIRKTSLEPGYSAEIHAFFMGKQYFLFVNESFRDIRLVGAPPSSIGKFGGDTDNWMWPRHTGDFSLFRIYADRDNKPADYSKDNIPYRPAFHFPVSLQGVKEGDFTMVFGYPGTTSEYVPSYHIDMIKNGLYPKLISIRTKKIEIIEAAMIDDPLIRIQYSAKKAGISNSWKKWIGEIQGLESMAVIENKMKFEDSLTQWIDEDNLRKKKYGNVLPAYRELYAELKEYNIVNNVTNEVFFINGIEAVGFARNIKILADMVKSGVDEDRIKVMKINLTENGNAFFKNFSIATDKKLFAELMRMYGEILDLKWQAPEYRKMKDLCGGDFSSFADKIYAKTIFADRAMFNAFVTGFKESSVNKLNRDPLYLLALSVSNFISSNVRQELESINREIRKLNSAYMTLQMEFDKERLFYPDANSTLRVAFGTVKGYSPKDAVYYSSLTTLKGIIEKDNPEIYDYNVPQKLRELFFNQDFGQYAQNGIVPVCFIANNHTTGGNSGSPVINAYGHLIGINFDRAWEGVASDLAFNPELSRNISLDIRYALFIIDKFAGAGYLLDEMTIIK